MGRSQVMRGTTMAEICIFSEDGDRGEIEKVATDCDGELGDIPVIPVILSR